MTGQTWTIPPTIETWAAGLEHLALRDAIDDPERTAIFSADMIEGFCTAGPLASPRVQALVEPVADLMKRAHDAGVRDMVLVQDTHHPDAPEFGAFGPHCIAGTDEARTVAAIAALPFRHIFTVVQKNSLHPAVGTTFDAWLDHHPKIDTAIVVGDCTDLCTYHLAMHLRLRANARNIDGYQVIVPLDCVDTYDLPDDAAAGLAAMAHDGEFFHQVFAYHLALNGVRVVAGLS